MAEMKAPFQQGQPLLQQIRPRNLLSFGPETAAIPLQNLNVLIGPNGAGKSNLLEVLTLLQACPTDIRDAVRRGGGISDWIWKGGDQSVASLEVLVAGPGATAPLRHALAFREDNLAFRIEDESIEVVDTDKATAQKVYRYQGSLGYFRQRGTAGAETRSPVKPDSSVLSQRRDPEHYPEVSHLAEAYGRMRIYRDWTFGRGTIFRTPQKADLRTDRLEEDYSNLGLFLNKLRFNASAKAQLLDNLRHLYEGVTDFELDIKGGTVQIFFIEGNVSIPANRLSDGSLRYLCLLAILCDPTPPPLVCIEEPELGLHPDILPKLADLLFEASKRTQLIVTTHSDTLIDALTEHPEAVVVCEKHDGQTEMRRLQREELVTWLDKYRLGQLWTKGQIGGTRW